MSLVLRKCKRNILVFNLLRMAPPHSTKKLQGYDRLGALSRFMCLSFDFSAAPDCFVPEVTLSLAWCDSGRGTLGCRVAIHTDSREEV